MKNWKIIFAIVLMATMGTLPLLDCTNHDAAATPYYVSGYIVTANPDGNEPLEGVTVTIIDNIAYSATTDSDGYFIIDIANNTNLIIQFVMPGYSLRSCPAVYAISGSDYLSLNLSEAWLYDSATRTYQITSGPNGMQPAIMAESTASISGVISYPSGIVSGATVTLVSLDNGSIYKTVTDTNGRYKIECPTGKYDMTVESNGFNTGRSYNVEITSNGTIVNIPLVHKDIKTWFSLDLAHLLMLLGVVFGLIVTTTLFLKVNKDDKKSNIKIIDDSVPEDDEDDINP